MVHLSYPYLTTGKTIALTRWTFVSKVIFLLFNVLSRLVIAFLRRNKHLLIHGCSHHLQWFWSTKKSLTVFIVSPSIYHEVMGQSVQSLSRFWLFVTPWTAACQASLSVTNSRSLPKLMSIESVTPSNHLILCRPFIVLPSIFPSIRVFPNESALLIRCPKYWSFSFNISHWKDWSPFRLDLLDLLAVQETPKSLRNLIDREPDELWAEVCDTAQEMGIKTIHKKKKCKNAEWCPRRPFK